MKKGLNQVAKPLGDVDTPGKAFLARRRQRLGQMDADPPPIMSRGALPHEDRRSAYGTDRSDLIIYYF
ncbi:hypothetical protein [Sphingopyxis chilensis]